MIKVIKRKKNPETVDFHQYQKGYHVTTIYTYFENIKCLGWKGI